MATSKRASVNYWRGRSHRYTVGNLREDSQISQAHGSETAERVQPLIFALDLSYRIFDIQRVSALCNGTFQNLQVLILAGSCLSPKMLAKVLREGACLQKLDVSDCGLPYLPDSQVWSGLTCLTLLFMHRNNFTSWEDVEAPLAAKGLQWLTLFESPVVSQPDVRGFIIRRCPKLLAVDLCAVTDDERICYACPFPWTSRALLPPTKRKRADGWRLHGSVMPTERSTESSETGHGRRATRIVSRVRLGRFSAASHSSERVLPVKSNATSAFAARAAAVAAGETEASAAKHARKEQDSLMEECAQQVAMLRDRSAYCSAACAIQTAFRAYYARQEAAAQSRLWIGTVTAVQKHGRSWLGKKKLVTHLQELLAESNDLDLLLSAKEMLTIRANKLVENSVRRWVQQRKDRRKTREAATHLGRYFRGFMARNIVLGKYLELNRYRHVYFPAAYSWEFRVLLNMARQQNQMSLLPADYEFERADIIGVRIPQVEELPPRNGTLTKIINFRNNCLLRPSRGGAFLQHAWDGPFHKIIDHDAPERIKQAYRKIKRRAANVDNRCRKAFLKSCVPGPHPIQCVRGNTVFEEKCQGAQVGFTLQKLLNCPEESWASGQETGSILASLLLRHFIQQAKHLAAPPQSRLGASGAGNMDSGYGAVKDEETNLKVYRDTIWLAQPMLRYSCDSPQLAHTLLSMVTQFPGTGGDMPLIRQVPFIAEKSVKEACAAACIQATYRAYRTRKTLPCSVFVAAVLRRATICIQRAWRWSLLKRRMELLTAALKYVDGITTDSLYIEERLYKSLNLINCVDRYAPLIHEHNLALGYSTIPNEVVLVRSDLRGQESMRDRYLHHHEKTRDKPQIIIPADDPRQEAERLRSVRGGFPDWMWKGTGIHEPGLPTMQESGPEDPSLVNVCGLQGLLLQDIGEPQESQYVTQVLPTIQHAAELAKMNNDKSKKALIASAGTFRFVPLKFANLAQAKRRALALFLGTFSARHRVAVPLLQRHALMRPSVCHEALRLWGIYGLTWQAGDRTALFQLRKRYMSSENTLVSICGSDSWRNVGRKDIEEAEEKKKPAKPAGPPGKKPRRTKKEKAKPSGEEYVVPYSRNQSMVVGAFFSPSRVQGITPRDLHRELSNALLQPPSPIMSPLATPRASTSLGASQSSMKAASPGSLASLATTASPRSLAGALPNLDEKFASLRRGTPSVAQLKQFGHEHQHLRGRQTEGNLIDVDVDHLDQYKQTSDRRGTAGVKALANLFHSHDRRHSAHLAEHRRIAMTGNNVRKVVTRQATQTMSSAH